MKKVEPFLTKFKTELVGITKKKQSNMDLYKKMAEQLEAYEEDNLLQWAEIDVKQSILNNSDNTNQSKR